MKKTMIVIPQDRSFSTKSFAQLPTPYGVKGTIRILVATRPRPRFSIIKGVDLSNTESHTVLQPNPDNLYEVDGILPGSVLQHDNQYWLYYTGIRRLKTVAFQNTIGLAVSKDGVRFTPFQSTPILQGDLPHENYFAPFVMYHKGLFHLFYAYGDRWVREGTQLLYHLFHSISKDGIHWKEKGKPVFPIHDPTRITFRPTIIKYDNQFVLFFCQRRLTLHESGPYEIACATSTDLVTWTDLPIHWERQQSDDSWDSQMQTYPFVFKDGQNHRLFYCGNDFGRFGFGEAKIDGSKIVG